MSELVVVDLGRCDYATAMQRQRRLLKQVQDDPAKAFLILVEHVPAIITRGRSAAPNSVRVSADELAQRGVQLIDSARGGDVTWHGPGQLVTYPIVSLRSRRRPVHKHVANMEQAIIDLLAEYGLAGIRREGRPGVWIGNDKIAAIGVAVERWTAWHGLALNVSADLSGFDLIVPCGLADAGVTSLSEQLARKVSLDEVKPRLLAHMARTMGFSNVREGKSNRPPWRPRLPAWLRQRVPGGSGAKETANILDELGLATVCQEAVCPNRAECYARRTATFMILGDRCTRSCRFCGVADGPPTAVRDDEPAAVAEAATRMKLKHIVVTSVTRDDLPDGGAGHFAATIHAIREKLPSATVEVLTPDFHANPVAIKIVCSARPSVFNHNLETVARLTPLIRPQADYARSLRVLKLSRNFLSDKGLTKSGLMIGLGETPEELSQAFTDLRSAGVDILTIGQYLAPSPAHWPVARFVQPEEFDALRDEALALGFRAVAAGPLVRSSYHAEEVLNTLQN